MGELIASSLGDERHGRFDLLGRWISFQLADVVASVGKARSARGRQAAMTAATEMIVRLWQHRTDWPTGWPPERAQRRMDLLAPPSRRERDPTPTGSAWVDRLSEIQVLAVEEIQLWWKLGLLETGVEDQRELLAGVPEPARGEEEPEDIRWLRREVAAHDEAATWAKAHNARTRAAVRELAAQEFADIAARRATLVTDGLGSPLYRRRPRRRRSAQIEARRG